MFEDISETDIAIIGIAGRFPKARNVDQFWRNLRDGVESISFFTDEELVAAGLDPSLMQDPNYVKASSVLEDVELFDAQFFDYVPREAEIIDPQQRFFLECAWEALENAGYDSERFSGPVGVFAGVSLSTYLWNIYSNPSATKLFSRFQIMIGNDKDHLATRVSYKLNLKGPSLSVQTTCSTSLVAVHLACQSLLNGECDMALAGGVSIKLPQTTGYLYREGGISSPDGHCRAFDAKAQGTIGGNGVGVVCLKPLRNALGDGDQIYAVIKGSAINNDGSLKVGYTAPSIDGQTAVIKEAHAMAGVAPETITYVEAHGTGTTLGDPIEIAALTNAFRTTTQQKQYCAIGSVKTNVGHLDAAAGVTGLIKTVLSLKHRMIPPSLHFEQGNPKIDFLNSPFYVNATLRNWERNGTPRRAGVSSFGIGGTNAHVILEEAPDAEVSEQTNAPQLLLLSARTATALQQMTDNLAHFIEQHPNTDLADLAYTLQVGRRVFKHRRIIIADGATNAVNALRLNAVPHDLTNVCEPRTRSVVFMFPGQGSQYVNMGLGLYQTKATFREHVDHCSEILRPLLGLDLRTILYPGEDQLELAARKLVQTSLTQPALFVVEYAAAQLWMQLGVQPKMMIGHSIGEYVAACLAGVFSLEDALSLVATRGRLMQQLEPGAMLTVALAEQDVVPLLDEGLSLAAVNGPSLCVVAGAEDAIGEFAERLNKRKIVSSRLHTSHAFHSSMMEPILSEFAAQVRKVKLQPPSIPYLSNVTGNLITAAEATDANYWTRHLRQTVRFSEGLNVLLKEREQIMLEVGPGQTLSTLAKRQLPLGPQASSPAPSLQDSLTDSGRRGRLRSQSGHAVVSSLPPPKGARSGDEQWLHAMGQLWLEGVNLNWLKFHAGQRRRLTLPAYPFERQRYWIGASEVKQAAESQPTETDTSRETTIKGEAGTVLSAPEKSLKLAPSSMPDIATPAANGNGNTAPKMHAEATPRERLVAKQLELMSAQLAALRERQSRRR
jgi:acyl transferase domain-containing protein